MRAHSCIQLFATLWTVARQAPLSIEFFRKEYWSGLSFTTPKDFPDLGIKPASPVSPALPGGFFTTEPPGKPVLIIYLYNWLLNVFVTMECKDSWEQQHCLPCLSLFSQGLV